MEREKPAAFARRLGVHKSSVTRAIQSGRLILVDGLLDIAENLRRWEATKTGSRPDVAARHAAQRSASGLTPVQTPENAPAARYATEENAEAEEKQEVEDPDGESTESATLTYFTALRFAAQNNLVKLVMQLRSGRLYPLDGLRKEALALGATLRASLERLVDQTAPRLAVMADPQNRRQLLDIETRQLRRDIRREFVRAMRRLKAIHAVGQAGKSESA